MTKPDDWKDARSIPYDKSEHAFAAGEFIGLAHAVETLKALPEIARNTPGFQVALATVTAAAMERRADMAIKAMRLATAKGIDVSTNIVASYPDGLRVLPMDLADRGEA